MRFEQYVHGLRIERAKQLLLDTELDAARVAELSGFKTPQYFSRVFVRATGVTPIVFRTKSGKIARQERPQAKKKGIRARRKVQS